MLTQIMIRIDTRHSYCPVFRWIQYSGVQYSDGYCILILIEKQPENGHIVQIGILKTTWKGQIVKFEKANIICKIH